MKFVHLTPQPNIARVKRSGIRSGSGRRGRGVYAVPLMLMQQVSFIGDDRIVASEPRSSVTLWQWLAGSRNRHRNLAAIVFRTASDHWPADLYIELKPVVGTDWLTEIDAQFATIAEADLRVVRIAHSQGFSADLKLSVRNGSGVGKILHAVQSRGHAIWDHYDDSIEIIFQSPIASHLIERVTPLYRRNGQFKRDRDRQHQTG